MSIPPRADKWIVFPATCGLGIAWLLRSTVPGGFGVSDWIAIPLTSGVIFTSIYALWCATSRLLARVLRVAPASPNIRLYANGSFLVVMIALMFIPYRGTVTVDARKDPDQSSIAANAYRLISGTTKPVDLRHGWPVLELIDAFDRAAHLEGQPRGTEPELRIWEPGFLGPTAGYVISVAGASKCEAEYRNDGITASVVRGHCASSGMSPEKRRRILGLLPELFTLNGKTWGCALGGVTIFGEGFVNRERFVFIVSNPELCQDSNSLLVARLVALLHS